jgi:hypothetical protein
MAIGCGRVWVFRISFKVDVRCPLLAYPILLNIRHQFGELGEAENEGLALDIDLLVLSSVDLNLLLTGN